jgi:antitoxin VapB
MSGRISTSTVFVTNRTQAVRLPKAVAFPDDVQQVDILKIGSGRLIVPKGKRWEDLFQRGPRVSEDFMSEREQPTVADHASRSDARLYARHQHLYLRHEDVSAGVAAEVR